MPTDPPDIILDDRMDDLQSLSHRMLERAEQLRADGLTPEAIAARLAAEFPAPPEEEDD